MTTTADYTPEPGHLVRVQRWNVPTPELPGTAERTLLIEIEGTVGTVRELAGGVLITLEGDADPIFSGYQFTGQDPGHGCSWTLQTEIVPLAEVAAYDQAKLDAQVQQVEHEKAAALALWERARDAEVIARQRLKGAQERLEAAMRKAARARPPAEPVGLDALTERRKADRAVMAAYVADLARSYGLGAEIQPEQGITRETSVDLAAPHSLGLSVRFQGNTPQSEPDTYVLSWHMRSWTDEGKGWQLSPGAFGSVNTCHGHKATDVVRGYRRLCELLARRFARIADGSAFMPAAS